MNTILSTHAGRRGLAACAAFGLALAGEAIAAPSLFRRKAWGTIDVVDRVSAALALGPSAADRVIAQWSGVRLRPGLARAIRRSADRPDRIAKVLHALGGWALTPLDAAYPAALRAIEEPPPVLYGLGDPGAPIAEPLVAVVGTRRQPGRRPSPRARRRNALDASVHWLP